MMCQALEAGGMTVVRSPVRDRLNLAHSDAAYRPNPQGLYEPAMADLRKPAWWRQQDGKVVKCVVPWLQWLPVHEYRVVFTLRDPEEIRQSYRAAFGTVGDNGLPKTCPTVEEIAAEVSEALKSLENRKDVHRVMLAEYRGVVGNANSFFHRLARLDGWPIDVTRAAAVVDPAMCRFRRENLVAGL